MNEMGARQFFAALFIIGACFLSTNAFAQESSVDDSEFWKQSGSNSEQTPVEEKAEREVASQGNARAAAKGAGNKARYRLYPGGQDEQEIEVQKTLPAPVRDAGNAANASGLPSGAPVEH